MPSHSNAIVARSSKSPPHRNFRRRPLLSRRRSTTRPFDYQSLHMRTVRTIPVAFSMFTSVCPA